MSEEAVVHYSGARGDRTFVPVDCSSLVPTLIESELVRLHEGAFTTSPISNRRKRALAILL